MEGKTLEDQLGFIKDDFDLQEKITEKLDKQEESIFDEIDKQSEGAKKTLFDLMKIFEGMEVEDMSEEQQTQLKDFTEKAGLDFGLVSSAMQAQKDRLTFENALKTEKQRLDEAREARLERKEKEGDE